MKKSFISIVFLLLFSLPLLGQNCLETAKTVAPVLSENARKIYLEKLAEAIENHQTNPNNADNLVWLGRRTAYIGNYKEAIKIFTEGAEKFPKDARFYRHRGHRFITIRCFDDAIKDFETAAKLVKGKADEIEPDGLPNARNIPTSTLQSNIFYHLGLAYYVKGDFANALKAYQKLRKSFEKSRYACGDKTLALYDLAAFEQKNGSRKSNRRHQRQSRNYRKR